MRSRSFRRSSMRSSRAVSSAGRSSEIVPLNDSSSTVALPVPRRKVWRRRLGRSDAGSAKLARTSPEPIAVAMVALLPSGTEMAISPLWVSSE